MCLLVPERGSKCVSMHSIDHITLAVLSHIIMNFEQTPELFLISGLQISDWLPFFPELHCVSLPQSQAAVTI